jgi:non-lysosomal glucosylceramidase
VTSTDGITYAGDRRRAVALPLGGIGTGNLALGGTGVLKQWQLHHQGNHLGFSPQSFFALRFSCTEPPLSFLRVLRGPDIAPHPEPAPLVNDPLDAAGRYATPASWPGVRDTTFRGAYPFARIDYQDDWPAEVRLEAYTPFVPLDAEASGLPVASFTFRVTNKFSHLVHGWLVGTLQNLVGWDGVTPIRDGRCAVLGGNVNRLMRSGAGTGLVLANDDLDPGHPGQGSMALWTPSAAKALPQFDDADTALAFADSLKLVNVAVLDDWSPQSLARGVEALRPVMRGPEGPSAPGRTWAGALAIPFGLRPGETAELQFVYAWHFPNRLADFDRFGDAPEPASPPWIGNHYSAGLTGAQDVIGYFAGRQAELLERTRRWHDAVYDSSLPAVVTDVIGAQPSLIRSPTTFRTADGRFYGFEGVLGESTFNWNGNIGGSCPLNCTHVWNYAQAVAHLFPSLERSMRETDWDVLQAPEGYLPHRVLLPPGGPQLHGVAVGGPARPALDGMLGTVLKTYREVRHGAGAEWLARYLPHARRLMDYVARTWDVTGSGVLTGDQPVTHDISLQGPNIFVGGLWLAALRAMQEMVARSGEAGAAAETADYRRRFETASASYDELLWNGEYYSQKSEGQSFDFGDGCLADQLFGQWWAHQLDLGHLLPPGHVRTALESIVRFNYRGSFRGFEHGYRVFADADDAGLLICTWPRGGRPAVPIRYADEVWTGVEYQVAAHCMFEGLTEQGLKILTALRSRYDGSRRNPYNEIECGDHYSRAMAGFSVLAAYTGAWFDAQAGHLRLGLGADRYPLLAGTGWGQVTGGAEALTFRCLGGSVRLTEISVPAGAIRSVSAGGQQPAIQGAPGPRVQLTEAVVVSEGTELTVYLSGAGHGART